MKINPPSRRILPISILIFFLALIILGYILVYQFVILPGQPVAIVNGVEISIREFQKRVRYERYLLVQEYDYLLSLQETNTPQFYPDPMRKIEFQLDPRNKDNFGELVLQDMIRDILIRLKARELGIIPMFPDAGESIQAFFGYYQGWIPIPPATPTTAPTSTLSTTQQAILAANTPAWGLTQTPTETPFQPTETPAPSPTPTRVTFDNYQIMYQEYMDELRREIGFSEYNFRYVLESQLFEELIKGVIVGDDPPFREMVWARHILVEDEETALEVASLLKDGEDWCALADEFSTDPATKDECGDLGWFRQGVMVREIERIAFSTPIGEVSDPVEHVFGWSLTQVLGHEDRPLENYEHQFLQDRLFEEWLDEEYQRSGVVIFDIWKDRVPAQPALPPSNNPDSPDPIFLP